MSSTARITALHRAEVRTDDSPLFGRTYQPVCTCPDDPYRGPFLAFEMRAEAFVREHLRKVGA